MAVKSYKEYLRVASNQIRLKRSQCSHPHNWKDETTLYYRCECGMFVPFRNPLDVQRIGEFGQGLEETPAVMAGVVCNHELPSPTAVL